MIFGALNIVTEGVALPITPREILVTPSTFLYLLITKNDELPVKFVNKINLLIF